MAAEAHPGDGEEADGKAGDGLVVWSAVHLDGLRARRQDLPDGSRDACLLDAQIAVAEGEPDRARQSILAALAHAKQFYPTDTYTFENLIAGAVLARQFDLAMTFAHDRFGGPWIATIGVEEQADIAAPIVRWVVTPRGDAEFWFSRHVFQDDRTFPNLLMWVRTLRLFEYYCRQPDKVSGEVLVTLFDVGLVAGLSFCDSDPTHFLVPDPMFLSTGGYHDFRAASDAAAMPWNLRYPQGIWRGSTTGLIETNCWSELPRIALCLRARQWPDLIDAGITQITQVPPRWREEIEAAELVRSFVPAAQFGRHKYQIDIDGNTNAWAGLFQKLYSGSPVFKVESPHGFRQWYYGRLRPWVNYVPVASDLGDLFDKMAWFRGHDDLARQIGERGRYVAHEMTLRAELAAAVPTLSAALAYQGHRLRERDGLATDAGGAPTTRAPLSRAKSVPEPQSVEDLQSPEATAMMLRVESLGGHFLGCEVGTVQRAFGAEPLGLLRWSEMTGPHLIAAMHARFDGVGLRENTEVFTKPSDGRLEYRTRDTRFLMEMHSFIHVEDMPLDQFRAVALARLSFLRDKLLNDLAAGEKLFVFKLTTGAMPANDLQALRAAMRTYGPNTVLYVRLADATHPSGSVDVVEPGLLVGHIDRFGAGPDGEDLGANPRGWLSLLRTSLELMDRAHS